MKYTKEDLERMVLYESKTYSEIGKLYGVTGNSIRKACKKFGINLPKRRKISEKETFNRGKRIKNDVKFCKNCGKEIPSYSPNVYCSLECSHEGQYKERIEKWKNEPSCATSEYLPPYIKRYMMEKFDCKCELCGWGEMNKTTGKIPLEIHHINGDCTDNREENLQLLCPNCHSLTETFGSLNNGKSKRYKLKEYKNKK